MDLAREASDFFARHLPPRTPDDRVRLLGAAGDDADLDAGRAHLSLLASQGWSAPGWPATAGGRDASPADVAAVARALAAHDTPDLYPFLVGLAVVGPTLLDHGTDEQVARFLPSIADGSSIWCQLFSEPDAGSDLAALGASAVRDGDQWVVTGQKTWSSRAHYADRGLLLARTDPEVGKHEGITAFALPMAQAGVEVRPLRQLNGDDHFNQVFLDGAIVDDDDRIGAPGDGWRVAVSALGHERSGVGGGSGGMVHRDQVVSHVRASAAAADPVVRQRLARAIVDMEVAGLTTRRAAAAARAGRPGPESSGSKVSLAAVLRQIGGLAIDVQGPAGVTGAGDADWATVFLTSPSISIRGGTDEIQRNIIGERVLGLPPEPRVDKGVPFTQTRRSGRPDHRPDEIV